MSGYGQDGTVVGGVTFGVPGALAHDSDTAARFDGTTGTVDLGSTFAFSGAAPFSWEIWVKPAVLDTSYRPFMSGMTFNGQGNPVDGSYMFAYSPTGDSFGFERYHTGTAVIVSDVDDTTKKAASLGGKVLMPAMEIAKVGRFSVVQDPTGAVFSPFRSART